MPTINEEQWMTLDWVEGMANGDYTATRAALWTRDGRRVGNSVQTGFVSGEGGLAKYLLISDAGNSLLLNEAEMKELFYPPEVVMKKMLPAQQAGLDAVLEMQTEAD